MDSVTSKQTNTITGSQTGNLSTLTGVDPGAIQPLTDTTDGSNTDGSQFTHCENVNLLKSWQLKDGSIARFREWDGKLLCLEGTPELRTVSEIKWDPENCLLVKTVFKKEKVTLTDGNQTTESVPFDAEPESFKVIKSSETEGTPTHASLTIAPCLGNFCSQVLKNEAYGLDETTK